MIGIGSDHNGFMLKQRLAEHLAGRGYEVRDFGTFSEEPVDYPDIAAAVAGAVRAGRIERAVLVCGTGLGMAIAANKVPGVFAAPITDVYTARRARESNDVQIITLGADIVGPGLACAIVEVWLQAEFAGGASARKVAKVRALEEGDRDLIPSEMAESIALLVLPVVGQHKLARLRREVGHRAASTGVWCKRRITLTQEPR